jgi:hypothetical protein
VHGETGDVVARTSISPVWIPARTPMSKVARVFRIADAHSIARPGLSNVATKPSPRS